jgi:hypothetical protein
VRLTRLSSTIGGSARRLGLRYRTLFALVGGVLAVLPAALASGGTTSWTTSASTVHARDVPLQDGYDPIVEHLAVDGSLPKPPDPAPLPAYDIPSGVQGIPASALAAYRNAAGVLTKERPGCHIDWALIASIGRIESNHARGGYVDAKGNALEPILGPVLDGTGDVAAVPDTDNGYFDGDKVWDRAVGPMQFIPATWLQYASDGNGDGVSNPGNSYDAALATARFLCDGGFDLTNPDQLRTAIYRYNDSDVYVTTVILWAAAYRAGVTPTPDSKVPIGAPDASTMPAPPPDQVPVPPVPAAAPGPPPTSGPPGTSPSGVPSTSDTSRPGGGPGTSTTSPTTLPPCPTTSTDSTPPTTTSSSPTTVPTTTPLTTPPPTCVSPTPSTWPSPSTVGTT